MKLKKCILLYKNIGGGMIANSKIMCIFFMKRLLLNLYYFNINVVVLRMCMSSCMNEIMYSRKIQLLLFFHFLLS